MHFNDRTGLSAVMLQIAFAFVFLAGIIAFGNSRIVDEPGLSDGTAVLNPSDNKEFLASASGNGVLFDAAAEAVLPTSGYRSKIVFKDSVLKLIQYGAIDRQKFEELYRERGGLPREIAVLFQSSSEAPVVLTRENANSYLNVLWPLGLSQYRAVNEQSPVKGENLFNFASTGGWTLGKEDNGGAYFNKFRITPLTPTQEALVKKVAENTFRPCCGNSTFFQDCNHGSALLGLLELGASQGLTEDELFREALAFNSFWFPDTYIQTAVYFQKVKGMSWRDVDPKVVMSRDYSSGIGWYENVRQENERLGLVPEQKGGASCGV